MSSTREPFEPECWYHIFNHARGADELFVSDLDYKTFFGLVNKYVVPVADIYAYCLMRNHFHFLVQFRNVDVPKQFTSGIISDYLSHQWGNVQNTYTKKKNFKTGKRGGLFCQSINRNLINSEEYLLNCVVYIHNNPVKHGFCLTSDEWRFSSYNAFFSNKSTKIEREKILGWFGGKQNFIDLHNSNAADLFAEKYNLR